MDAYNGKTIKRVNTDKFNDFLNEHNEAQSSDKNPVHVELRILTIFKQIEGEEKRKEAFIPLKVIYGGMLGVKKYLKKPHY